MYNNSNHSRSLRNAPPRQQGMALVLALLFIVLLSIIVAEFLYDAQVEASFAITHGADFEAYLAAKSGVAKGMGLLMADIQDYDNQDTATNPNQRSEETVAPEGYYDSFLDIWATGIEPVAIGENNTLMGASIADEYGKINLNALLDTSVTPPVPNEALAQVLEYFFADRSDEVEARDLVEGILDWMDFDDGDEEYMGGAENDYYMGLENPYPCKNGPMDSIEELLLVKGMTKEFYFGDPEQDQFPLSEYLTVHGDWEGKININTAPLEVLGAVESARGAGSWSEVQDRYDSLLEQPVTSATDLHTLLDYDAPMGPPPGGGGTSGAGTGSTTDDENEVIAQDALNPPENIYRWDSYCFRIFGNGLAMEEVMVRVEAYVWRTPLEVTTSSSSGNNPGVPSPQQEDALAVEEPMRILSWKVIR